MSEAHGGRAETEKTGAEAEGGGVIGCRDLPDSFAVVVQNGTSSAPVKELVEITAETSDATPTVVYTVPTGKRLIINDINLSTNGKGFISIQRNTETISKTYLGLSFSNPQGRFTDPNYQRSYLSGIQFNESDTVGVVGSLSVTFFELRGYQTAMN